jgi:hypothetical protein
MAEEGLESINENSPEIICGNKNCSQRGEFGFCYTSDSSKKCPEIVGYRPQQNIPPSAIVHHSSITARAKRYSTPLNGDS